MEYINFVICVFLCILNEALHVTARDICDVYSTKYTYCQDGFHCCDNNTRCCKTTLSTWEVTGIVLAVLFGLCICIFCAIALTKKKKFRPRQLVHPRNDQRLPISTTQNSQQMYQNYNRSNLYYCTNTETSQVTRTPYLEHSQIPPTCFQPPPYSREDPNAKDIPPPPEYKETP